MLTYTTVKKVKPGPEPVKLADGKDMYLLLKHIRSCLLLLAAALAAVAAAPLAAQGTLPPAQQLLERYAQAIGGRDRIARYSSARVVSEMAMPAMGMKGTTESYFAKPNRSFSKTDVGAGIVTAGFDGTVAWYSGPMQGPELVEGQQLEAMREGADFVESLTMIPNPAAYGSIETVERTEMGGKACWKVRLVRNSGRESFNCYDTETGLLAGSVGKQESVMGTVEASTVVSDYKEFGGILIPTRSTGTMLGQQIVTTTRSVEFDTVQPSVFELPKEIRAGAR